MRNLKLTIEYNGANFSGWQKQNGKRTVQQTLEDAFLSLTGESVTVEGSGRTDKGVHALGQVASVQTENQMPLKNFKIALNDLLPADVTIKKVEKAEENFHARFSAKKKAYKYLVQIGGDRDAIKHDLVAFYPYQVELKRMQDTSKLLLGKHNFKGFCSAHTNVKNFEREIFDLKISKRGKIITFLVIGNGFLYNMVRIIVGTLLDVGRGKLSAENVKKALETGNRQYAGKTMSANGLYLQKVEYRC